MTGFTISELASEFDVTPRTLRYYEEQGILQPAREGQSRRYSRRDRARLRLALRGKRLGFSLDEIRQMIDLYDGSQDAEAEQLRFALELGRTHRARLEAQLHDLQALMGELQAFETQFTALLRARGDTTDARNV